MPQSDAFWDVKKEPRWDPKSMTLTHSDIDWYHRAYQDIEIIDSCGSSPNVPLLSTKGEINYSPVLARRQLGYPMRDKPNGIHLSSFFLKEGEDHREAREQIAKAWRHIHRNIRKDLGPRGDVSLEPYLQWVQT